MTSFYEPFVIMSVLITNLKNNDKLKTNLFKTFVCHLENIFIHDFLFVCMGLYVRVRRYTLALVCRFALYWAEYSKVYIEYVLCYFITSFSSLKWMTLLSDSENWRWFHKIILLFAQLFDIFTMIYITVCSRSWSTAKSVSMAFFLCVWTCKHLCGPINNAGARFYSSTSISW